MSDCLNPVAMHGTPSAMAAMEDNHSLYLETIFRVDNNNYNANENNSITAFTVFCTLLCYFTKSLIKAIQNFKTDGSFTRSCKHIGYQIDCSVLYQYASPKINHAYTITK